MAPDRPGLVVDDGGDVTLLIHKGYELENGSDWVNTASASHEEQVIKNLLKRVAKERPGYWGRVVKDWKGVSGGPPPACTACTSWPRPAPC